MTQRDVPGAVAVRAVAAPGDAELAKAISCFDRAIAILERFETRFAIARGFIE